ncbi:hypothetical protein DRO97_10540 [Archaeoglobales archaeon]|nr:MAG: hypothetical protein DRO97_10540 [Archaeoglobales archaeon]
MDRKTQAMLFVLDVLNSNSSMSEKELFEKIKEKQEKEGVAFFEFEDGHAGVGINLDEIIQLLLLFDLIYCRHVLDKTRFINLYEISRKGIDFLKRKSDIISTLEGNLES